VLPNTGHSHFLFASLPYLCERLARWFDSVLAPPESEFLL